MGAENDKMKQIRERIKNLYWNIATRQLEGIGVIEIILILVIIIGLIVIFRKQISGIIEDSFKSISGDSSTINKKLDIKTN